METWDRHMPLRARTIFACFILLITAICRAHGQGQWVGPWDWSCIVAAPCTNSFAEISHAAVIPTGPHKGKVIFWHQAVDQACNQTYEADAWIFDPLYPTGLLKIGGQLDADVFCSGTSWNSRGELIVAGANRGSPQQLQQTYRFRPGLIGSLSGVVPWLCMPFVDASSAWQRTGDMIVPRFYPTVVPLSKRQITFASGAPPILSGAHIIIGGAQTASTNTGTYWWEFLPYGSATLSPTVVSPTSLMPPTAPVPPPAVDLYPLMGGTPTTPTDPDLSGYPRAFQLSNDDIFVAFDVNDASSPPNPAMETWVLKLYEPIVGTGTAFELWRGNPPVGFAPAADRNYGSAVLIHQRLPQVRNDRLIVFGGGSITQTVHAASNGVQEFEPHTNPQQGTGGKMVNGLWHSKAPMLTSRDQSTPIILPTREVLLVGGTTDVHLVGTLNPIIQYEIYEPGDSPTSSGGGYPIPSSNPVPVAPGGPAVPTARMYHHVAALLPDGSVFVSGGDYPAFPPSGYPAANGEFTGEVYRPSYVLDPAHRPFILEANARNLMNAPGSSTNKFKCVVENADPADWEMDRVVLTRPAAVTHFFDSDQRYIELGHTLLDHSGSALTLDVWNLEENLGPPGFYMLWVILTNRQSGERIPTPAEFVHFS